jgi:hypothetical protein
MSDERSGRAASSLAVPSSTDLSPHFETVEGRQILYVDGWPHVVLTVESHWSELIYGNYHETMTAYDYLYPAARALGLNAIKVPVKWSVVEPQQGVYDFSYVDHVLRLARENDLRLVLGWFGHYASGDGNIYRNLTGEVFAPMYVIEDDQTYPRAVDGHGVAHHNSISYDYQPVIDVETAAFRAFMAHLKEADADTRTVLMVQVENEIAVFGADRRNRAQWRDHSPASNQRFQEQGFTDDLKYSAWRLSSAWIRPLTDVGTETYPLPLFLNYVGGQLSADTMGGSPGEDVATYMEQCPNLAFIGLNLYASRKSSVSDFRSRLDGYRVDRNIPCITETNSDAGPNAPRLAYLSVGEYGAPIFAPWSLHVSYPTPHEPYVLEDGSIANGGPALRDCYTSLRMALPFIAYHAGTDRLAVFMSPFPGEAHSETRDVAGAEVRFTSSPWGAESEVASRPLGSGQAIVIHPAENEFVVVGFRCGVAITTPMARWPQARQVRVERGCWEGGAWQSEGEYSHSLNQSNGTIGVGLSGPAAVRIHW